MGDIEIIETSDYYKFKYVLSNRNLVEKHVLKLMESISNKNLLKIQPCLISPENEIIDGQHRIEAAKRLNVSFYYISTEHLNHEDILTLNNIKLSWTILDFINFYKVKKYESFIKLTELFKKHPDFNLKTILSAISPDSKNPLKQIKHGQLRLMPDEKIDGFIKMLYDFKEISEYWDGKSFMKTLKKLYQGIGIRNFKDFRYNHNLVMQKIKKRNINFDNEIHKIHYLATEQSVLETLVKIQNAE